MWVETAVITEGMTLQSTIENIITGQWKEAAFQLLDSMIALVEQVATRWTVTLDTCPRDYWISNIIDGRLLGHCDCWEASRDGWEASRDSWEQSRDSPSRARAAAGSVREKLWTLNFCHIAITMSKYIHR